MAERVMTDAEKRQILAENDAAMAKMIATAHDVYELPVAWPFCAPLTEVKMREVPRA